MAVKLKDPGLVKFKAELFRPEGVGTGTFFYFPYSVEEKFGTRANVKVEITVDGYKYRGLLANMGWPKHCIVVRKEIRDAIAKNAGDKVDVTIKLDTAPRIVEVPDYIQKMLSKDASVKDYFMSLSFSHQKEYVDWITTAKKEETKTARLAKMMELLRKEIK